MRQKRGLGWALFCIMLGASALSGFSQTKYIRLRNESIPTLPKAPAGVRPQSVEPAISGLYLIQFEDRLRGEWRDRLQSQRVVLLRYVPDDAFIVRLDGVRPSELRSLPFVRWAGEYRSRHKIHEGLAGALEASGPGHAEPARILFSPDALDPEMQLVRHQLSGAGPLVSHSFGRTLNAGVTADQLRILGDSPLVLWIERAPRPRLLDEVAARIVGGPDPEGVHGTATQRLGYDGRGVVVAVADSGLDTGDAASMHPDIRGRVDAFFHYGDLADGADEHGHGTHVAGIIAGDGATGEADESGFLYGLGVAPEARLVVQRIFDGLGQYESPPSNERLTRDAVRAGAVIGSNSWGEDTQGRYDLSAVEFDALVRDADAETPGDQPYWLEFSAGNAGPGPQTIGSPAVAKNVVATGASQNNRPGAHVYNDGLEAMADFSSRGPCEDGRIKPDLVAPGTWIASLQSAAATAESPAWPISDYYQYQGGTSQAGPQVSGAAAVFMQYYRETVTNQYPSPALVKAALIHAAADMAAGAGTPAVPNHSEGWGRVDLTGIIGSSWRHEYIDQSVLLSTGQPYERGIHLASRKAPLKVTLVYTDVPALPAAIPALVNDLDLEVVGPDGQIYRGNQFVDGESIPNAGAFDPLNNVEAVRVSAPVPGEYRVLVRARNVVEDACRETPAVDQDFALVISGDLPEPGVGFVIMDRQAYTVPGRIQFKLVDANLASLDPVPLLVRSTTEAGGETVLLTRSGPSGVYTGYLDTASGLAATNDHRLQIGHEDVIEAVYQDTAPAGEWLTTARADLVPPEVNQVIASRDFGKIIIRWSSDEPADSVVYFGTEPEALALMASNVVFTGEHSVVLDHLTPGISYWFSIASRDEAGNRTVDDNGGLLYQLESSPVATVLLVDAYEESPDSINIPRESYTDALDQTGVNYEVWSVADQGRTPRLSDLQSFRVVIWRISDNIYVPTTLSPADQANLQDYLEGGGSLLIASMELLHRLGNVPFRTNVLHVQTVEEDVGVPSVYGFDYDPIGAGIRLELDYSNYTPVEILGEGPDFSDTITPATNAAPIFFEGRSNRVAGLRYPRTGQDASGRVVFLSFPLDAIPAEGDPPNNRAHVLRNTLSFLAPGMNGLGTVALDNHAYTIPARATVEVADSDLTGQGQAVVQFCTDSDARGQAVTLHETSRRGLFRGFITLVALTNAPIPGQIQAREGDHLWVEYRDQPAGTVVQARGVVDSTPARITRIQAEPRYEQATIAWSTSESTDALVQFGESTFLGRTAYRADLRDNHVLTLSGLLPDRTYYYQVVSRDSAGNAAIDDNQGKWYTLRTLKPLKLPWVDSLEPASTDWVVLDGEFGSDSAWQLGPPENGVAGAHSAPNAWGSSLTGAAVEMVDTALLSPAVDLEGGNQARLRFWHYYDFTRRSDLDMFEVGQLHVSTNDGNSWILLAEYTGLSDGWELAEIDLTPYLGSVIRFQWYHGLFSYQRASHVGWLIDDLSLSVTNIPLGTVVITNNLAQAQFELKGPLYQAGRGWNLVLTNAPEGDYVVTYNPVPYYESPPSQTNRLTGTNQLVITGLYRFPDTNRNGLSDLWERAFFGGPYAGDPREMDSDQDGATDEVEFRTGTHPTDALSVLVLSLPVRSAGQGYRLLWPASVGYAYRVETTTGLDAWKPVSDWIRAGGTIGSFSCTNAAGNPYLFFRLEVKP